MDSATDRPAEPSPQDGHPTTASSDVPILVWTEDADGRHIAVSGPAGRHWADPVHPADRPPLAAALSAVRADGVTRRTRFRVGLPGGRYRWFAGTHAAAPDGSITSAAVAGHDAAPSDPTDLLQSVAAATAGAVGRAFFDQLVMGLAAVLRTEVVLVAERVPGTASHMRPLAYFERGAVVDAAEYDAANGPCEHVIADRQIKHYPDRLPELFPGPHPLTPLGLQSYLGAPLLDARGDLIGTLCVADRAAIPGDDQTRAAFSIFATRAAAELERVRAEDRVRATEAQFRMAFEQAPMPILILSPDGRRVTPNAAHVALWCGRRRPVNATGSTRGRTRSWRRPA